MSNYVKGNCAVERDCFCKKNLDTEVCTKDIASCGFFVEGKPMPQELNWLWGNKNNPPDQPIKVEILETPLPKEIKAEVAEIPAEKPVLRGKDINPMAEIRKKSCKKETSRTCADCNQNATHQINGYHPIFVCQLHARKAELDGFQTSEIK